MPLPATTRQLVRTQALAWLRFDAPIIAITSLVIFFGLPIGDFAARIAFFYFGIPSATYMLLYRILEATVPVSIYRGRS